MLSKNETIVALDIGTTKIAAIICKQDAKGQLEILGVSLREKSILRKGVIVNIDEAVKTIQEVIQEAEIMAGVEVFSVCVGVSGEQTEGLSSRGVVAISSKNQEITPEDVSRSINLARSVQLGNDKEILHVIPKEFIVDGQGGVFNPTGMNGVRLEAEVYLVSCLRNSIVNIQKAVEKAGYLVEDVVLQSIASAEAVLNEDEKELGVILIDVGGGSTDMLLYKNNSIWHSSVIPYGGMRVTKDVAYGLKTTATLAEEIKIKYGHALESQVEENDFFRIPLIGERIARVSRKLLASIMEPRLEEILTMVKESIPKGEYIEKAIAGVVLTGGGSLCSGICDLAEKVFGKPVRIGFPTYLSGLQEKVASPVFSTAVGLAKFKSTDVGDDPSSVHIKEEGMVRSIKKVIRQIFQ